MNEKWDKRFLDLAEHISQWSKDPSTKVGAVIINPNKKIVSVGYNGFPPELEDNEKYLNDREEKYSRTIHAEMNAILFAKQDLTGCTLYTYPFLPCTKFNCVIHTIQCGIKRVVTYETKDERWKCNLEKSKEILKEANLNITLYDIETKEKIYES